LEKVYQKLIKALIKTEAKNQGNFDAVIDADNKIKRKNLRDHMTDLELIFSI